MKVATPLAVFITLLTLTFNSFSQVVFNRTSHDFGEISNNQLVFEQDFIFRNTGDDPIQILSVKTLSEALTFVHTRSEVLSKEYGFVKVKLRTDQAEGLFHDEIYVTLNQGDELRSEVLYVRANITSTGELADRQFVDGVISTSVEVSPEDIETMEGFMGEDKLKRVESELLYLKKQVGLKDELIAKLSDDLYAQSGEKEENLKRLAELQSSLESGEENEKALKQVHELSARLEHMQSSDSALRAEIDVQGQVFADLQKQADSARMHAQNLSTQLAEKFKSEAEAIEKAQQLEADLAVHKDLEADQKNKIDSLNALLAASGNLDEETKREIERLGNELASRQEEQELQQERAAEQEKRITLLNSEKAKFQYYTDSLANTLESATSENTTLASELEESRMRASNFEAKMDSLKLLASQVGSNSDSSREELLSLQTRLQRMEDEDARLKSIVEEREAKLLAIQSEKEFFQNTSDSLNTIVINASEENKTLTEKLETSNSILTNYEAQMDSLRSLATQIGTDSDSATQELITLQTKLQQMEVEDGRLKSLIAEREAELLAIQNEKQGFEQSSDSLNSILIQASEQNEMLVERLEASNSRLSSYEAQIDSLQTVAENTVTNTDSSSLEFLALQSRLAEMEVQDASLKDEIALKDNELQRIEAEKSLAEKNMKALERATTKQVEMAQTLMYKINGLASRESQARISLKDLQTELRASRAREDSTRLSVERLTTQLAANEGSMNALSSELDSRNNQLSSSKQESNRIKDELSKSNSMLASSSTRIDSLQQLLGSSSSRAEALELELEQLRSGIANSNGNASELTAQAKDLEAQLANAHMSNQIVFDELKAEVDVMQKERNDYKSRYKAAMKEVGSLNEELAQSKSNEANLRAFVNEIDPALNAKPVEKVKANSIVFRVNIYSASEPVNIQSYFDLREPIIEYTENNRYKYAAGSMDDIEAAYRLKQDLKSKGYQFAAVVAFRGNTRISIKEALATASH